MSSFDPSYFQKAGRLQKASGLGKTQPDRTDFFPALSSVKKTSLRIRCVIFVDDEGELIDCASDFPFEIAQLWGAYACSLLSVASVQSLGSALRLSIRGARYLSEVLPIGAGYSLAVVVDAQGFPVELRRSMFSAARKIQHASGILDVWSAHDWIE